MDKPKVGWGTSNAVCCKIGVLFAATEVFDAYAAEGKLESTIETAKTLFGMPDVKIMW